MFQDAIRDKQAKLSMAKLFKPCTTRDIVLALPVFGLFSGDAVTDATGGICGACHLPEQLRG